MSLLTESPATHLAPEVPSPLSLAGAGAVEQESGTDLGESSPGGTQGGADSLRSHQALKAAFPSCVAEGRLSQPVIQVTVHKEGPAALA